MITLDGVEMSGATFSSVARVGETSLAPARGVSFEEEIFQAVCDLYEIFPEELKGPSRKRREAWPRQIAAAVTYQVCPMSAAAVGRIYGDRHYSYVYWCRERVNRLMRRDELVAAEVKLVLCEAKKRQANRNK